MRSFTKYFFHFFFTDQFFVSLQSMFNRLRSLSKPPSPVDDGPSTSEPIFEPPTNLLTPVASLDDSQQEKLASLREYVNGVMLPKDDEYYENEKGFLTDRTLSRYLRARKWDVPVRYWLSRL
jgi:hypothetical protein